MSEIRCEETQKWTLVEVSGPIDDSSDFSGINWARANSLNIDLSGVTLINSIGVSKWLVWTETLPGNLNVVMVNVPPAFINLWNLIPNLVPPHWHLDSFYVPYHNEESDQVKSVLWTDGVDFNQTQLLKEVVLNEVDPNTGKSWQLDVIPEQYFSFLEARSQGATS